MKQLTNSKQIAISGGRTRGPVIQHSNIRHQHNSISNRRTAIQDQIAIYIHDLRPVNIWEQLLVRELATIQCEIDRHVSLHAPTLEHRSSPAGSIPGVTTPHRSTRITDPFLEWTQSMQSFSTGLTRLQTARRNVLNALIAYCRNRQERQATNPPSVSEQTHQPAHPPSTGNPAHPSSGPAQPTNPLSVREQSHQPTTPPPSGNPSYLAPGPEQPAHPPSLSEQSHQSATPPPLSEQTHQSAHPPSLSEQTHRKPAPSPPRRST